MQFPLEAQGEFWKQMVPDWSAALPTPNPTVPALSELAKRLKGAVLISHSQSGIYPFQTAALDRRASRPSSRSSPAPARPPTDDLAPYEDLPILVLFGDYVDSVAALGAAAQAVPRLRRRGERRPAARPSWSCCRTIGIHGNSHMLMQDKNSLEIADWLAGWIEKRAPGKS